MNLVEKETHYLMKELILTEQANKNTQNIDLEDTLTIVSLINKEDQAVPVAIEKELKAIASAVDMISESFLSGGNLLYFGAGTSGRLGVLDASECPPTFGVEAELVRGYIAGGDTALRNAVEGAEDIFEDGENDLIKSGVTNIDVVTGISASGNAPYICGVLSKAKEIGAKTIALTCNKKALIAEYSDIHIAPEVGPEVITGSTRLKAGTAHKMILNMLTTGAMIKTGKTYHNFMIDLKPVNKKLIDRATRIIQELTNVDRDKAYETLLRADKNVKVAVVMLNKNLKKDEAIKLLNQYNSKLRLIIG
jgi:N-acetylmuramic acid 6-phosphate etherase